MTVEVAFALGSNLGDPVDNLCRALALLEAAGIAKGLRASRFYRTAPWGPVPQGPFVNACAVGATALAAADLLRRVKAAEVALGRADGVRWGPRVIDIDILYRGEDALASPALTLPHPRLMERAFVLVPLSDLVPDRVIGGITVAEAAARVGRAGVEPL